MSTTPKLDLVLVSGISGSGKSEALHALEDAAFYCIDNLPPALLRELLRLETQHTEAPARRVAVAMDVRSANALPLLLPLIEELRGEGFGIRPVFLDASTDALVRRFSETRRPHPLSAPAGAGARRNGEGVQAHAVAGEDRRALTEAIEVERVLLADLRQISTVIDTSQLRPAQLRAWMRGLVGAPAGALTLVFESFAYKHGVPLDADLVFDLRVLPNPHYVRELRALTGRDTEVAAYLEAQPEVAEMLAQIEAFLRRWLPAFESDQRGYLTVALGCTGGQHRSPYAAETLALRMGASAATLIRHRELEAR